MTVNEQGMAETTLLDVKLNGPLSEDYRFQAGDSIRIDFIPNYSRNETITLQGEFCFSVLAISSGGVRQVLRRAGGFTKMPL